MHDMKNKKLYAAIVAVALMVSSFFVGVYTGHTQGSDESKVALANKDVGKPDNVDFSLFWKAWNILNDKYASTTKHSVTDQEKVYGAIQGLAASLGDPYTVFFPPVQSKDFNDQISGTLEGVGMEVGEQNDVITVIAPLKGSPAEKAGIMAGDIITAINGSSTQNMTVDQAVKTIRGPKGTTVEVTIFRKTEKAPRKVTLTRDVINVPTIDTEQLPDGIYKIALYTFTENSPKLFRDALNSFLQSGSHKLILDLRGNPGGYLEAAVDMASWFLPKDQVVVTEDYGGNAKPDVYTSKGYNVFNNNLKMVVLIDGGSASASEILSGALQDHKVAQLVGTKSFGKGSVQELVPLSDDTSLKVTIARWLTPSGKSISETGLTPDVVVTPTQQDIDNHNDVQLKKAEEILKNE